MMKRNIRFILFLFITSLCFGKTVWHGEDGRLNIMYKILDPLIVKVEKPNKIVTNTLNREFTYSSKNGGRKIRVEVAAPYEQSKIDNYLREIYKYVYFELESQGKFKLTDKSKVNSVIIEGEGYFIDENERIYAKDKRTFYSKEFANRLTGNAFTSVTDIDVNFKLPEGDVPMGSYTGTLTLNVWFSGGILK